MLKVITSRGIIKHYLPWMLVALLYGPVFFILYHSRWKSSDYTHAYFILPVFIFLVWRKSASLKELLQRITSNNSFVGLSVFLAGVSVFIYGWRGNSLFIATLSLLPVLYGLILYFYGSKITKVLFFPVLYLIFLAAPSVSIIDSITLPLRHGVSLATEGILKYFHYPITREGLLLSIGSSELFIGQPCSGFRSMITMVSAGLVYLFLSKATFLKKLILASSIIPLTLLGNLIRIIILCLITFYFGEAAGQGFFHNFSGILIIVFITIGLLGLEHFLGKYRPNTSQAMPQMLLVEQGNRQYRYPNKNLWITSAILLVAIIFCFGFPKTKEKYEGLNILTHLKIPHEINGWQGKDVGQEWNIEDEKYFYISQVFEREYINGNKKLFLIMLDAENSHNPKTCFENAGYKSKELNNAEFDTTSHKFKAYCLFTEKNGEGYLLISWICVNKQIVDWVGQRLKLLWFSLFDQKGSNLLIRLDIPCSEENIEDALNVAKDFISDLIQTIPTETANYLFGEKA